MVLQKLQFNTSVGKNLTQAIQFLSNSTHATEGAMLTTQILALSVIDTRISKYAARKLQ